MDYNQNIDIANDIASESLERLHADKIPPTPHNFEVWYAYFANTHADLKTDVNKLIKDNNKVTQEDLERLHAQYLSKKKNQERYQQAGDQIHSTLEDVSGLMENVKSATSEYTDTLDSVTSKLSSTKSPEDVGKIVKGIVADTEKMMENNKTLEQQLEQSSKAMDALKKDLEQMRLEAATDGLTGLSNRKSFDERIVSTRDECEKEGKIFTLIMLDIDHFKAFNDNYGHQVGDQVLRLVARTLIDGVKGRDTAARYGGEEFAIILPDTNLNAGVAVADNLRKAIASKEVINRSSGAQLGRITMSAGVAQFYAGESIENMIERADSALYTAKHNGRNQVAAAPTPHQQKQQEAS